MTRRLGVQNMDQINMKLYILICVNEDGDVVGVQPFTNQYLARATMDAQYMAERREFEENGTLDDDHDYIEGNMAAVGNDRYHYVWQIHEREL